MKLPKPRLGRDHFDEVVGKVNEKIEGNAVKIDETLAKAEEVAGQVEQIKESTQVIKDIFKDKK